MFATLHAHNLRSISNPTDSGSLAEYIFKQPLWADYFRLCNQWNINLESNDKGDSQGPWHEVAFVVRSAARPVLSMHERISHKTITLRELDKFVAYHERYLTFIGAIMDSSGKHEASKALESCVCAAKQFQELIMLVESLLSVWIPRLSMRVDVAQLTSFASLWGKDISIRDINSEVCLCHLS
jgi:hypothetical protein